MKNLSLLDWLTIIAIMLIIGLAVASPAQGQVQYPTTVKIGKLSVTVPSGASSRTEEQNTSRRRVVSNYYREDREQVNITVTVIQFKDTSTAQTRLTEFLTGFISAYATVDHMASIQDGSHKGMNLSTEIYHGRGGDRYTYVESRILADDSHLYAVTIETEVSSIKPLRVKELTEIFSSMKVN